MVFVLDASSSVTKSGFELMTFFVKDILLDVDIDGGTVRVGVIIYSNAEYIQFHLNAHSKKQDVYNAIDNIPYRPGSTNTADALKTMRSVMFTQQNGGRSGVDNVAVFLTDGLSNINSRRTVPEAEMARANGIHIYAIGIGMRDTTELDGIASKPVDENRFAIKDFDKLKVLKKNISSAICSKLPPVRNDHPPPPNTTPRPAASLNVAVDTNPGGTGTVTLGAETSRIDFVADPENIHPTITNSLQLRCSVKKTKLQNERTTLPSSNEFATTSPLVPLNDTMRPTLYSPVRNLKSEEEFDFSKLLSLVMTKKNKEIGLNETIASVSGCDSPVIESKYVGTVQVEGNTEGSPREEEQGFITLTWKSPLEEHAGEFYCEASALNPEKHSVTLIASLEIQAVEPKMSDLINYISTNNKQIVNLETKVSELSVENQYLQNKTKELIQENVDIRCKQDQVPVIKVRAGTLACSEQKIHFKPAFNNTPKILTSFKAIHTSDGSSSYSVSVSSVNNTMCIVRCSVSDNWPTSATFDWMAIGL